MDPYIRNDAYDALNKISDCLSQEQRTTLAPWFNKCRDAVTNLYGSASFWYEKSNPTPDPIDLAWNDLQVALAKLECPPHILGKEIK